MQCNCFLRSGVFSSCWNPCNVWNPIPTDRLCYIIISILSIFTPLARGLKKTSWIPVICDFFFPANFVRLSQAPGNPGDSALCSWRVSSWSYPSAGQQWKSNTKDGWNTSITVEKSLFMSNCWTFIRKICECYICFTSSPNNLPLNAFECYF